MIKKFEKLKPETKIITIWGPLPNCLPDKVNFPYIINKVPFKKAENLQAQLLAVFGVKCIDFVTAWEFAERYTKSISGSEVKNDRFLTIIQTLIIWINAKELGVVCTEEIPESIKTYISIMKMHFDIDFEYLLKCKNRCKPFILYIPKEIMESRLNINVSAVDYDKTSKALTQQLTFLEEMVHGFSKDDFVMTDSEFAFGWHFFVLSVNRILIQKLESMMEMKIFKN